MTSGSRSQPGAVQGKDLTDLYPLAVFRLRDRGVDAEAVAAPASLDPPLHKRLAAPTR